MGWAGMHKNPWGHCVQQRAGCASVYRYVHMEIPWTGGVGGGKEGLAMAMSSSLPIPAPGPWACGSSCSLCGRNWNGWLRRGEPDVLRVLS